MDRVYAALSEDDKDALRILVDWVEADHSRRSFLIRSRHGSRELWVEIAEAANKFEIIVPLMSGMDRFPEIVFNRIARFAQIRKGE